MSIPRWLFLLVILVHFLCMRAATNPGDLYALLTLKNLWDNTPPNWDKQDPCGRKWDGITCNNDSRVTEIKLSGLNLRGYLPTDMPSLSELRTLDLSNNRRLTGNLPANIGILKNLRSLVLVGCSFSGPIPESIGSLSKLEKLFLNSNNFNGTIPNSVGNLSKLVWFDVTDNKLTGEIPVSNETTTGLDNLIVAEHFHLGRNNLSGVVPSRLFSSRLAKLIHVVFDHNQLSGSIPETLGEVETLEVIRMDWNFFDDSVPQSLNKLRNLRELYLGKNLLTGPLPNLPKLISLTYIDLSNNNFNPSDVPSWLTNFPNLTTILMENTTLQGSVPTELFSLSKLQTIVLSNNHLNGTLNIITDHGKELKLIDLRNNSIEGVDKSTYNHSLLLDGNPVCEGGENVCSNPGLNFFKYQPRSKCLSSSCTSNKLPRPTDCKCAKPYIGYITFRSLSFSYLNTSTYFDALNKSLMEHAANARLPIDSVFLSLAVIDSYQDLILTVAFFPSVENSFNITGIVSVGNDLNDHKYTAPPEYYGPYTFFVQPPNSGKSQLKLAIILGVATSSVLLVLLVLTGLYAYRQKRKAQIAAKQNNPFASWDPSKGGGDIPQIKEARWFSFEDMRRITNDFSEGNEIGQGGYGKVYNGTLPGGQVVAIKRAQRGSMQGALEFKTEIELLSRVHHKNIVNLVGFCFDQGEQMLIYEYVKGGTLSSMIAGKRKTQLNWTERLKVVLGAARGLGYLHNFADPPIIHRDVKSSNILLDERLNAKVADFGLSKLLNLEGTDNFSVEVKGTLGYLDPEYYSTHILTEKSDVYSFGVVMLELLTGKRPIEKGKHIVRAVREEMSEPTSIYTLVDPAIDSDISMVGLKEYLNLALRCVEEYGANRPSMHEVVKELESSMEASGMITDLESRTTSMAFFSVTGSESSYTSSDPTSSRIFSGSTPLLR